MKTAMQEHVEQETSTRISQALDKIGGLKETDLCKFLPAETDGHLHHFTLKKLKTHNPEQLKTLLNEFIFKPLIPRKIDPKSRIRRYSQARERSKLNLNRLDIECILELAIKTENSDLLTKLGSKLPLAPLKKELIQSIKKNQIEERLWFFYVQAINLRKASEK